MEEPPEEIHDPLVAMARNVPADAPLWRGLVAATVAGIAGAIVWTLIVVVSDYEVGIVAWGIGALAGYAVLWAANGRHSMLLQGAAIVGALSGILLGKYLTFWWSFRDVANELDASTWSSFWDNLDVVFSWWDALWIGLAMITAWRILQPQTPADIGPTTERA